VYVVEEYVEESKQVISMWCRELGSGCKVQSIFCGYMILIETVLYFRAVLADFKCVPECLWRHSAAIVVKNC
jgi:hypothetical protein